ncbi:UDP-3-O-(3-hydroxymyristoyl)glucosamine N-acyltransferase [Jannaschia pagri]|uniref:UDP-3-O-acylglucosamine N-acyltransferase n=1 Tax=Jannaschia pagri TaxID=2829797 RepID=A0ABQ4NNL1_9RHOB|nr:MULTISPECIES: UDP-3-O-(3-hydroxymyristoyl)glucosamine N-acyltransferase [unclassified Jannaschia]GIT92170.1 UDP-3-O-(3-hydroxymyristoyl)glucosamine N-acyltransferase [Jannaschia sp. AI_61]GIT96005.1 UDP-3-O-(3-hydroxymyristoyl)glucosamine N-acyltransferase [Jannaschia sp. AI_62]
MFTLNDIAVALNRPVEGDGTLQFAKAAEPGRAGPNDLALAMVPTYSEALAAGQAQAAILWEGADWQAMGLRGAVTVPRARLAMARITAVLDPGPDLAGGIIHPTAQVHSDAQIGENVSLGAYVTVGAGAKIGAGSRLAAHVSVAEGAQIGRDALIHPRVTIGARVTIGDRFTCQPGAVIGGDGFSFVTEQESGVEKARKTLGDQGAITEQPWVRIHSLGSVSIGDDVEVGANTCIDKGTVADTTVGRGTKIDNLVHIGHNNRIGEDCLICGQVGMAGGSTIGNRVVLGGQCGVNDNISIGDDVVAGGATKIFTRVASGAVILGYPAVKMDSHVASYKAIRRLPRLAEQVAELRKTVANLVQSSRHDT